MSKKKNKTNIKQKKKKREKRERQDNETVHKSDLKSPYRYAKSSREIWRRLRKEIMKWD